MSFNYFMLHIACNNGNYSWYYQRKQQKEKSESIKTRAGKKRKVFECRPNSEARPCNHNTKTYMCSLVKTTDIKRARDNFYEEPSKIVQDQKLCHLVSVLEPKRRRPNEGILSEKRKTRSIRVVYFLRIYRGKKNKTLTVCRNFFLSVFDITKNRLTGIHKIITEGSVPKEKRGGDRYGNKNVERKQQIREFLRAIPASESHYNRNKSCRVYVSCELNISKLFAMYNAKNPDFIASKSMFKRIFYGEFNIGFSSPASDVCGTCLNLKNAIKEGGIKKSVLMMELRIHKVRANAFYKLLKEKPENSISFCFDLQQVHPLPKTPIQDAFYLRQISFYTLCCVDVDSKEPFFYTWSENQASRGSTEVGSALLAHLRSLDLSQGIKLLRLFCDGCGGQNKNSHIMHLLAYWLKNEAPQNVEEIIIHFPVRGHSYLPADRVFGRAEKLLKRHVVIHNPTEYNSFYSQVGTVRELGKEWYLYNIKELSVTYSKVTGIKELKRICIKKFVSTKGGIVNYKGCQFFHFENDYNQYLPFLKRGQKGTKPLKEQPIGNPIPAEKKKNVVTLLEKQFNSADIQWQNLPLLEFFKNILEEDTGNLEEQEERENNASHDEACDCLEEDKQLHI